MAILSALSPRSVSIAIMLAGSTAPDAAMAQSSSKPIDSVIDDILKDKSKPPQGRAAQPTAPAPSTVAPTTRPAAVPTTAGTAVTPAEMEAVRQAIRPCWFTLHNKPASNVAVRVEIGRDRAPVKAEIVDKARYGSDPDFRAAADAAHRAVMNPRCQPWPLSPEKYNSWRIITFIFDPRDF